MRVLIVQKDPMQLAQTLAVLRDLSHDVSSAQDDKEARGQIAAAVPEAVFVDVGVPIAESLPLIREIRAIRARHYVYVFALATSLSEDDLHALYEAGCDGELRAPLNAVHLGDRLNAAERILRRESELRQQLYGTKDPPSVAAPLEPAAVKIIKPLIVPVAANRPPVDIVSSTAWRTVTTELQVVSSAFLALDVTHGEADVDPQAPVFAGGIVLSNAERHVEIRLALATDEGSALALTTHMFGEESQGREAEMVREFVNVSTGAVKTAFGRGSMTFSGGPPESLNREQFQQYGATSQHRHSYALVVQGARILVRIGVDAKNLLLTTTELQAGMILGNDAFNAKGMLLLRGGTQLSSALVERLRTALGADQLVDVAWARPAASPVLGPPPVR